MSQPMMGAIPDLSGVDQLLGALATARTGFEIFKCFRGANTLFGFDWFAAAALPEGENESFKSNVILTNWDPELIEAVSETGLMSKFHITAKLRDYSTPQHFRVAELSERAADTALRKLLREHGHLSTVFFPLHRAGGLAGYISFSGNRDDIGTAELMALSYICAHAHQPLERIAGKTSDDENPLSIREVQVLQRLAHGKAFARISEELGISVNTVNYHLRKAMHSLGSSTKIQAVSLAARKGWIA